MRGDALNDQVASINIDWAEKHRPRILSDIAGNNKALSSLARWAEEWTEGVPKKPGVILSGRPGIGKTTAAHALANDFGWDIIEMNASDSRSEDMIRKVALSGAVNETFSDDGEFLSLREGKRKLIILDEADSLYERRDGTVKSGQKDMSDRGGKRAIVGTLKKTQQPIILIVNDQYALTKGSGEALKRLCLIIKFQSVPSPSLRKHIQKIVNREGVDISPDALMALVQHSGGDARSAINDLQSLAMLGRRVTVDDIKTLGVRDTETTLWQAMGKIFKTHRARTAVEAIRNIDEDPEHIILWIDENIPLEYVHARDMATAYQWLSKADIYLRRVKRQQNYGYWSYASELMTAGVALSKTREKHGYVSYRFPTYLSKMSRTKAIRSLRGNVMNKIGEHTHTSKTRVNEDIFPSFQHLFRNSHTFAVSLSRELELERDEISFILGNDADSTHIDNLIEEINAHPNTHATEEDDSFSRFENAPEEKKRQESSPADGSLEKWGEREDKSQEDDGQTQTDKGKGKKDGKTAEGDGKETGDGEGDGKETGDGDGKETGDGEGDGKENGDGDGKETGDGEGNGKETGDGEGDGKETGDGEGDGKETGDGEGDGKETGDGDGKETGDGDGKETGDGGDVGDGNDDDDRGAKDTQKTLFDF